MQTHGHVGIRPSMTLAMLLTRKVLPRKKGTSRSLKLEISLTFQRSINKGFRSLRGSKHGSRNELQAYLWFIGIEHWHLHVLSSYVFRLSLNWRGGWLLVVATDTDEEEEQGYGQGNSDTRHQDIEDFHFILFLGILRIWFKGKNNQWMKYPHS